MNGDPRRRVTQPAVISRGLTIDIQYRKRAPFGAQSSCRTILYLILCPQTAPQLLMPDPLGGGIFYLLLCFGQHLFHIPCVQIFLIAGVFLHADQNGFAPSLVGDNDLVVLPHEPRDLGVIVAQIARWAYIGLQRPDLLPAFFMIASQYDYDCDPAISIAALLC